jgi:signal transduction histidine kinase
VTPLVVADRYLEFIGRVPVDARGFVELVGTDADLLGRWLLLAGARASPDDLLRFVAGLESEEFRELATSQLLAVLTLSGAMRMGLEPWQATLNAAHLGEGLAEALHMAEPAAVRWRVLLARSGVQIAGDRTIAELLEFRGVRRELLEDAELVTRLFFVADAYDPLQPAAAQDAAGALLGLEPLVFQAVLRDAERRAAAQLDALGIDVDHDLDWTGRVWLRLQVGLLGRLLVALPSGDAGHRRLADAHARISRILFTRRPELLMLDAQGRHLVPVQGNALRIALASGTSTIARSARLGERTELVDRADQPVADRQMLRRLMADEAVCLPLKGREDEPVHGVMLFALDEESDDEFAMSLYAEEVGRRLEAQRMRADRNLESLRRYQQREEKRLREILHEVNNPLSVVQNYVHILQVTFAGDATAVERLGLISSELKRAMDLMSQVRNLSEISDAEPPAQVMVQEVDVASVVRRVVEMHRGYAAEHGAILLQETPSEPLTIQSDMQRIVQVLTNLLRNAIEAGRGHSVRVQAQSGVFREGREGIQLEVADTGPGMPRAVLERLGAPQRSAKGGDHAGLGLHIVYRLVGELKGSLDVRSTPGQGTSVSVFLPLSAQ